MPYVYESCKNDAKREIGYAREEQLTTAARREAPLTVHFTGYEKCRARHSFGPAVRQQYLVHYVLSGKGWFRTGGQCYHLESDSIFLIRPGEPAYYEADGQDPWEYCWVGFDGSDAAELMQTCGLLDRPVHSGCSGEARGTVLRLYQEAISNRGNGVLYRGLLYQFFSFLVVRPGALRPAGAGEYLKKATEYIRRNYMYDISVAGVASFVGVDRSYLYRMFCQWEHMPPQKYLLSCRMEAARRMLLESGYTVTEVAYSCGFRDVSSFDKAFRGAMGASPSAFRRSGAPKE